MALVAGFIDVVGYVALFGLFTAHVTGNFVLIGATLVEHSHGILTKLLALPMFVAIVAAVRLLVLLYERRRRPVLSVLLAFEVLFLLLFMAAGLMAVPLDTPDSPLSMLAGLMGVAAMGIQNAQSRLAPAGQVPTTIMTGNTTQAVIDIVDLLARNPQTETAARQRLHKMVPAIVSFAFGAISGALAYTLLSFWCLLFPIVLLIVVRLFFLTQMEPPLKAA
ncbi:MAG TPA: YoaK family protein [Usitatibacteraceae bacterium]